VNGCIDRLYTPLVTTIQRYHSFLHFKLHRYTHKCPYSITVSTNRFLATDLTTCRFFSFRDHAVARCLPLHTRTHSAIFSASPCRAQLSTKCSHGSPELNILFSTELFCITTSHGPNRKHRFQQYPYGFV
jgi:hypothetical protein